MIRPESALGRQMLRLAGRARGPRPAWESPAAERLLAFPAAYLDLVITPADVVKGANAVIENGVAGAAVTAGQTVYKDPADSDKFKPADANATAITATVRGIALHGATANQPLAVQTAGDLTISPVATVGKVYVNSATPGGIAPVADLAAGWLTTIIGVALSASSLRLMINNTGAVN